MEALMLAEHCYLAASYAKFKALKPIPARKKD